MENLTATTAAPEIPVAALDGGVLVPAPEYVGEVKLEEAPEGFEMVGYYGISPDDLANGSVIVDPAINMRWGQHAKSAVTSMAESLVGGQLQPVGLLELEEEGRKLLIFGFRRMAGWRYAVEQGLFTETSFPPDLQAVVLRWKGPNGVTVAEDGQLSLSKELMAALGSVNIKENSDRTDLTLMDRIWAINRLELAGWQRKDIAVKLGWDKSRVTKVAAAVYFPESVQQLIHDGTVKENVVHLWVSLYNAQVKADGGEKTTRAEKLIEKLAAKYTKVYEKTDVGIEKELAAIEPGGAKKKKKKKTAKAAAAEAAETMKAEGLAAPEPEPAKIRTPEEWGKLLKALGKTRIVAGTDDIARVLAAWAGFESGADTIPAAVQQIKSVNWFLGPPVAAVAVGSAVG